MIECSECGTENEDDAVFCSHCNHFLEWSEPAKPKRPSATPPAEPVVPPPADRPLPVDAAPTPVTPAVAAPIPAALVVEAAASPPTFPTPVPRAQSVPPTQPPAPPPTAPPPTASPTPNPRDPVTAALASVEAGHRLAQARARDDLAQQLDNVRARLLERTIPLAVVGEFKRGKSTLVNALLQTAVCPVDADIVTAVPTVVRFGEPAAATAFIEPVDPEGEPTAEPVALEALADFVSEGGNPHNRRKLRSVEVQVPHLMLKSGLCLVDTPGVGGLDSAEGVITLSALSLASGMLFLTDASQELTAPELEFLKAALQRVPLAACVVTKTDLYPQWRRMVELNRAHLAAAGLDLPVLAISSFLRLRARQDPELLAESGFPELVNFIGSTVVRPATERVIESARNDVAFATSQLEHEVAVERTVLENPAAAAQVVEKLDSVRAVTQQLTARTSTWQQMLTDGIQDLVAEVEFDLQERLRTVLREAEALIEGGDPKQTWADVEVWLRRQVMTAAVANFDRLGEQARDLASRVSAAFDLAAGETEIPGATAPTDSLAALQLASAESLENQSGRLASFLMAGRTATILPMLLVGTLGHLLLAVVAPVAMVLAAGIGQKVIRDERKRQVAYRRQQAKLAARKYIDEVAFLVGKDSRDALRGTQRQLRDEFQSRAAALQRSSELAFDAARRAAELSGPARAARAAELALASAEVDAVRRTGVPVGAVRG